MRLSGALTPAARLCFANLGLAIPISALASFTPVLQLPSGLSDAQQFEAAPKELAEAAVMGRRGSFQLLWVDIPARCLPSVVTLVCSPSSLLNEFIAASSS